ncbi:hypothetical protein EUX98_g9279 [Antrodiella citrinella]|uniref:Uncharacterized protein n=1 Tax=Antrodiella citrinella TaxID=2447956 RepID=A0A4V3XF86_9APHY|nr:hypothetical protein EUX98_g9279 [Antrodiella citrinella]
MPRCPGCRDDFTFQGLQSHRRQTRIPGCHYDANPEEQELPGVFDPNFPAHESENDDTDEDEDDGQDIPLGGAFFDEGDQDQDMGDEVEEPLEDEDEEDEDEGGNVEYEEGPGWEPPLIPAPVVPVAVGVEVPQAPAPAGRQHVEESLRQDVHVEHYPSACAGKPLRQTATSFSSYGAAEANNPYAPFPTRMDWEIARWGKIFGPGSNAMDRLLAIEGVCLMLPHIR